MAQQLLISIGFGNFVLFKTFVIYRRIFQGSKNHHDRARHSSCGFIDGQMDAGAPLWLYQWLCMMVAAKEGHHSPLDHRLCGICSWVWLVVTCQLPSFDAHCAYYFVEWVSFNLLMYVYIFILVEAQHWTQKNAKNCAQKCTMAFPWWHGPAFALGGHKMVSRRGRPQSNLGPWPIQNNLTQILQTYFSRGPKMGFIFIT